MQNAKCEILARTVGVGAPTTRFLIGKNQMQNAECKIEVKARSEKSCRLCRLNEKIKKMLYLSLKNAKF